MSDNKKISGFSKLSKIGKIKWLVENFFREPDTVMRELMGYWHSNKAEQAILDNFSENTISNFYLPYSIAPNFVINRKTYCIPMVIEESSVVAAASSAAKFWMQRGGFKAKVENTLKIGQIHLSYEGPFSAVKSFFEENHEAVLKSCKSVTKNMEARGGGVRKVELLEFEDEPGYCQIKMSFDTRESMGANFINTVLETYANALTSRYNKQFTAGPALEVVMCILSNYTPECLVTSEASCAINDLGEFVGGMTAQDFAKKFQQAVRIAEIDPFRATTHNKGIYNGIDAVVLATGNDFRAIEAAGHTYAARNGSYSSLSYCSIEDDQFRFGLKIPLALGTVGGLTKLHPMARRSLELLENPDAEELMMIIATVGLAQNFAAIRSLITTGIQKGHMKMHLSNVLNQLQATEKEFKMAMSHFSNKIVSFSAVRDYLEELRSGLIRQTSVVDNKNS